jgi:hypothetical protein
MFREGVIKNGMCNIVQSAGEFHPLPNHNTPIKELYQYKPGVYYLQRVIVAHTKGWDKLQYKHDGSFYDCRIYSSPPPLNGKCFCAVSPFFNPVMPVTMNYAPARTEG